MPTTATKVVLPRLGLGRASGLAPRSMIIVFAPSLRVAATANVGGAKAASVGRREGLALALPTSLGWSMLTSLARRAWANRFPRATKPRSLMSWYQGRLMHADLHEMHLFAVMIGVIVVGPIIMWA